MSAVPCCAANDRPSLALVATPGRDIAPDVVFAIRSNAWLKRLGLDEHHDVRSRPVELEPHFGTPRRRVRHVRRWRP